MREPNSNCRDSSIFESKVGHSAFIHIQIHHIEVAQGNIFMEQIIRFGLVLGQLAILEKKRNDLPFKVLILHCQCILSIFPATMHQFYANKLIFVNNKLFLYTNDQFALINKSLGVYVLHMA